MPEYHFITRWKTQAPLIQVWKEINTPEEWPQWWPYVRNVILLKPGDADQVGALRRFEWSSALPYRLAFDLQTTVVEKFKRLEGRASGELEGTGIWIFREEDDHTAIRYDWIVQTNKPWMNRLAPLLWPLFEWNHEKVMEAGRKGLSRRLGVKIQKK